MTRCKWPKLLLTLPLLLLHHMASADEAIVVSAKQVNGTWTNIVKGKPGFEIDREWKIWALGHQRLQAGFEGTYAHPDASGAPSGNTGESSGIANIKGNVATLIDNSDSGSDCRFVLTFKNQVLVVSQEGCAGIFGSGVSAAGTYKKTSSQHPKFSEH
jgi:hypothetical protein